MRFGENKIPDVGEIAKNTSLILVNQHYSLTGAKDLTPRLVEIGGVHLRDPLQPLSPDISDILATSNGVAYISWGSKMRITTLPVDKRNSIIEACHQSNLTILWKWDDDGSKMENQSVTVHARPWLSQQEILCNR
jgi:glucuronosyltransferase